nr:hypothetical protein [Candidatus Sigynarchaeota archaeon]
MQKSTIDEEVPEIKLKGLEPKAWEDRKPEQRLTKHQRFIFVDQFRGMTVLFLTIATVTWILGKNDPTLSIPFLDHGWQFFDPGRTTWNWLLMENQMYTIIDLGSSLFMFILGVTIPISFRSRQAKFGTGGAFLRMLLRVGIFIGLNTLQDVVGVITDGDILHYGGLLFNETLPALAWGTALGTVGVWLVKNPDRRFLIVIGLNVLHGTLYLIPELSAFRHGSPVPPTVWMGSNEFFDYYMIPWDMISFASIAIAGTCFWDWFNPDKPVESIRSRHLPIAMYSLIACFIVAWFIPTEHHDLTVSQNLLAISSGYFLLVLFFGFEHVFKFEFPLLTPLGRNALLLFIMQLIPGELFQVLGLYDLVTPETAWFGLVLCALAVTVIGIVGWLLHRKKIYLRL